MRKRRWSKRKRRRKGPTTPSKAAKDSCRDDLRYSIKIVYISKAETHGGGSRSMPAGGFARGPAQPSPTSVVPTGRYLPTYCNYTAGPPLRQHHSPLTHGLLPEAVSCEVSNYMAHTSPFQGWPTNAVYIPPPPPQSRNHTPKARTHGGTVARRCRPTQRRPPRRKQVVLWVVLPQKTAS